jgi:hypothetical protein
MVEQKAKWNLIMILVSGIGVCCIDIMIAGNYSLLDKILVRSANRIIKHKIIPMLKYFNTILKQLCIKKYVFQFIFNFR